MPHKSGHCFKKREPTTCKQPERCDGCQSNLLPRTLHRKGSCAASITGVCSWQRQSQSKLLYLSLQLKERSGARRAAKLAEARTSCRPLSSWRRFSEMSLISCIMVFWPRLRLSVCRKQQQQVTSRRSRAREQLRIKSQVNVPSANAMSRLRGLLYNRHTCVLYSQPECLAQNLVSSTESNQFCCPFRPC